MLTPSQYEAVGRLTLAFNDIEFVIETYTAFLIGSPEYAVGEWLAEQGLFQQKADRLAGVLKSIIAERPILEPLTSAIIDQLKQARNLAEERNKVCPRHDHSRFREESLKVTTTWQGVPMR